MTSALTSGGNVHPALERCLDTLRDGSIHVLSLDAFDTLLLRAVPDPTDAFVVLGHRLERDGLVARFVTPLLFAGAREAAERRARAARHHRGEFAEVTFDEIYAQIPDTMITTTRRALIDRELEVEADLVFADPDVAALARSARREGMRVAVVSDTYFSGAQLSALLKSAGLDDLEAQVFTSSDHRTGKASGLFDVVVQSLATEPSQVLHLGDHEQADVSAARAHGLRSVHVELRPPAFEDVIRREQQLVGADRAATATFSTDHGDHGITAVRARLAATGAPPEIPEHARACWNAGATVLGPVFAGFADWVVDRAAARGTRRLACVMREGTLLAPLLGAAAEARGVLLDAVPLWLSRQVCARAAIERGDYSELRIFVERRLAPTLAELCATLGIAPTDLGELVAHLDTRLDDLALREAAIGRIVGEEEVRARLVASAAELRGRLVRAVERVLDPSEETLTIVDLGWRATTQRLLVRALRIAGSDLVIAGLYLLTTDQLVEAALDGVDAEGFLGHAGEPRSTTEPVARSPEMLEQLCMGPDGTVLDLDESGLPILDRVGVTERQLAEAAATRDGILAFASRFRSMRPDASLAGAAALLRPMLARFVAVPTNAEVTAFGAWRHDDIFGPAAGEMLAHSDLLQDGSFADLAALDEVDAYWPAAIVARDTGCSLSGEGELDAATGQTIGLYADVGTGFDEAMAVHRPIPINARGLSYVQLGIAADGVRTLRLDPVSSHALVRIDRIALRLAVRDSSDPVVRVFTTPEELAAWELRDCAWLVGGLLVTRSTDPQMTLDLTDRVPGEVYSVLASVAFAAMELPEAAFDDDGRVTLGADLPGSGGVQALRELWAVATEVRAAATRRLASGRRTAPRRR